MKYLSVCSGIEAASVAWGPLGWEPWAFAEVEAFPSAVLAHHYPTTPNLGDMTRFKEWPDATLDVLVGGTPCQSFSVAGLRKGLGDPRGGLLVTYLEIARRYRPKWVVWENVPGVLSIDDGRAFGALLGGLAELGYGFAYRVLDAQFFGVPQRRRRVFVVGCLGSGHRAAAVLFERASLSGHPAPRREAGQRVTAPLASGASSDGGYRLDADTAENLISDVAPALCGASNGGGANGPGRDADSAASLIPIHVPAISPALKARDYKGPSSDGDGDGDGAPILAFDTTQITNPENRSNPQPGDPCHPLAAGAHPPAVFLHVNKGRPAGRESAHELMVTVEREIVPTLTTDGHRPSAVAFHNRQDPDVSGDVTHPFGAKDNGLAIAFKASHYTRGKDGAPSELAPPLSADADKGDQDTLIAAVAFQPRIGRNGRGYMGDVVNALNAESGRTGRGDAAPCVAFEPRYYTRENKTGGQPGDVAVLKADAAKAGDSAPHVATGMQVRRLTPRECERLQGFPDDYTAIPYRGKPAADGPRYKALGNSMAVPVMRWIGERIALVDGIPAEGGK